MSGPINVTAALRDMREKQSLNERWNENLAKRGLVEFRTMYKTLSKSGIDKGYIAQIEKLYDDIAIGGMYSSRRAEEEGILRIDGKTKYRNANW
jgi:hypothetical protein